MDLAEKDSPLQKNLSIIYEASERAGDLVDQILTFSSHTERNEMPLRLDLIIKKELDLLRSTMPANIELRQHIETTKMVSMDPIQAHQIAMNLCTNAIQAIGSEEGYIEVDLKDCNVDADRAALIGNVQPGQYLRLSVSDNGPGISPEIIERIFEPYFTTKEKSKDRGMGLGLATIHGIAIRLGGAISVKSTLGHGSRFDVYFPQSNAKEILQKSGSKKVSTGTERVAVVDEDLRVIALLKEYLGKRGYQVTGFTSSLKALDAICRNPESYDIMLADIAMPTLDGPGLVEEIRKPGNDMPIILCTEYSKRADNDSRDIKGVAGYLTKPISEIQLAGKIREALDSPSI
jgi:CheY-like chemotaxis protein